MKLLAILSSAVAVATAQPQWPLGLVAHPNGAVVPADEPAVVAARADHFAAKGLPVAPIAGPVPAAPWGVPAPLVAHPNGAVVPADEPAVVAARADHLAAKGAAFRAAVPAPVPAYGPAVPAVPALGPYPGLVAHPNGALVPAEPADVVAARADHLAAHG